MKPSYGDPRHGINGYSNLKCRCPKCRKANATWQGQKRMERAARLIADPSLAPHGNCATYDNWACRCVSCVSAKAYAKAAYSARRAAP